MNKTTTPADLKLDVVTALETLERHWQTHDKKKSVDPATPVPSHLPGAQSYVIQALQRLANALQSELESEQYTVHALTMQAMNDTEEHKAELGSKDFLIENLNEFLREKGLYREFYNIPEREAQDAKAD